METEHFENLVLEALDALPEEFKERLENVDVVVDDVASSHQLKEAGLRHGYELLGLYEGVPLTERGAHYGLVLPDKISIFKRPIERSCRSDEEIKELVTSVVKHEIAHFFGISDGRLEELGR